MIGNMRAHPAIRRHFLDPWSGDVAILAIHAAPAIEHRRRCTPDAGGGTLLGRLENVDRAAIGLVPAHRDLFFHRQIALEWGFDAAGMDRKSTDSQRCANLVEAQREQGIGGLRLPIGGPLDRKSVV